jgi:hypothetical protein
MAGWLWSPAVKMADKRPQQVQGTTSAFEGNDLGKPRKISVWIADAWAKYEPRAFHTHQRRGAVQLGTSVVKWSDWLSCSTLTPAGNVRAICQGKESESVRHAVNCFASLNVWVLQQGRPFWCADGSTCPWRCDVCELSEQPAWNEANIPACSILGSNGRPPSSPGGDNPLHAISGSQISYTYHQPNQRASCKVCSPLHHAFANAVLSLLSLVSRVLLFCLPSFCLYSFLPPIIYSLFFIAP